MRRTGRRQELTPERWTKSVGRRWRRPGSESATGQVQVLRGQCAVCGQVGGAGIGSATKQRKIGADVWLSVAVCAAQCAERSRARSGHRCARWFRAPLDLEISRREIRPVWCVNLNSEKQKASRAAAQRTYKSYHAVTARVHGDSPRLGGATCHIKHHGRGRARVRAPRPCARRRPAPRRPAAPHGRLGLLGSSYRLQNSRPYPRVMASWERRHKIPYQPVSSNGDPDGATPRFSKWRKYLFGGRTLRVTKLIDLTCEA